MSTMSTHPLRLPRSVKAAAEKLAREEGVSMNQLVATAVAEKLAAMKTAEFFLQRRERADLAAFRRLLEREGGEDHTLGGLARALTIAEVRPKNSAYVRRHQSRHIRNDTKIPAGADIFCTRCQISLQCQRP
jgi:hypothetical protein